MNWNRALSVFIGIFIIINLILYFVIQGEVVARFTVSAESRKQLHGILEQQGIDLQDFLPDYYPMATLDFLNPEVDREAVLASVFSVENYTPAPNRTSAFRYISDRQEVIFHTGESEGLITYAAKQPVFIPSNFTEMVMVDTAEAFAKALIAEDTDLVLTDIRPSSDRSFYILEFNERYKGSLLFCNYVIVKIDRTGVLEAKAMRYLPDSRNEPKREIVPVDQVLYKFMLKFGEPGMVITGLDLGYDVMSDEITTGSKVSLVPYYRIKTSTGSFYYVSAYDNKIYSEMR